MVFHEGRTGGAAFSLVVGHQQCGVIPHLKTLTGGSAAQVQILCKEKKLFIKSTNFLEHLSPNEQGTAADGMYLLGLPPIQISKVIASKYFGIGKPTG